MLPKKKRVTKDIFRVLSKEGRTLSTPFFLFYYKQSEFPRYAFVTPKNTFKKAVLRTKWRRIGYNILRDIPLKTGLGIFIYKKQAFSATSAEIKNNIIFTLKKAGFIEKTF